MTRTRALLTTALPAALIAALALTGCSGGSDLVKDGCVAPGTASDGVKIAGDFGKDVTIESETPITVTSLERTVAIAGDGEQVGDDDSVTARLTAFNGKTGEAFAPGQSSTLSPSDEQLAPWASGAAKCGTIGDRVVMVTTAADIFQAGGGASYQLEDGDAVVAVFDLTGIAPKPLDRAEGKAVDAPAGFPTVKLADNGEPTITIPKGEKAPKKLETATVIEGDGAKVGEADSVTLHYTGAVWSSGKVFDSSWQNGQPITMAANGFVPGFVKAIVGQKVGSQIIAIIPASEGYGDKTAEQLKSADATKDDVMVFVIDILASTPAG